MKRFKTLLAPAAILALTCACAFGANKVSAQDQGFINKAWNINTAEIQLGQMAQQKATNEQVKQFGEKMINDHTELNNQLSNLATQCGATLPTELTHKNKKMSDKLSKLNGSEFDKEYMNDMIKGHEQAVAAFKKESKDAAQTPVDKWAGKTVAMLEGHLDQAKQVGQEVGAPAAENSAQTAGSLEK